MSWSSVVEGFEVVGTSLALHRSTVWRRTTGFAERQAFGGLGRSPKAVQLLAGWLGRQPSDLRLRLILKVGGKRRSSAWLGLSAVAGTPQGSRARLEAVAADLGEALDVWGLFAETPSAPPRYARCSLGLVAEGPGRPSQHAPDRAPRLLQALAQLHLRPSCTALAFELCPAGTCPELVTAIDRERRRVDHLDDVSCLPWFMDPTQTELGHAREALGRLWEEATAGTLRVRLHGTPPGSILRSALEDALSDDLGRPLQLLDAEPSALTGGRRALYVLLGAMAAGREQAEDPDRTDRVDPDEIPF